MDRQMDQSDFIGRCLTNVKYSKVCKKSSLFRVFKKLKVKTFLGCFASWSHTKPLSWTTITHKISGLTLVFM